MAFDQRDYFKLIYSPTTNHHFIRHFADGRQCDFRHEMAFDFRSAGGDGRAGPQLKRPIHVMRRGIENREHGVDMHEVGFKPITVRHSKPGETRGCIFRLNILLQ